jgi:hypothetical protein
MKIIRILFDMMEIHIGIGNLDVCIHISDSKVKLLAKSRHSCHFDANSDVNLMPDQKLHKTHQLPKPRKVGLLLLQAFNASNWLYL